MYNALKIVVYPNPILRKQSKDITTFDDEFIALTKEMTEKMYLWDGIGLAAPQVGLNINLFVIDPSYKEDDDKLMVIINPKILYSSEETQKKEEGCLSLPNIYGKVERSLEIKFEASDLEGNRYTRELSGLDARVFQHEFDHLNGVLFIDKVTPLDKMLTKNKVKKLEKLYKNAKK